ncbi:hypothetical protein Forpi1262_v018259 [Fusarium oxysporum f. sp. raphani]|uniref:Rhodopsin domain-containing protein n=1 Tax=Fusarium oxysporum f. sp. raphani TaxID=96318 RepID=A0A8J5NTR5_FUSOX|nr:hypothetical protein Forpi1262_v018259 [Fusarium oxysporum f. sp. raphani]
MIGRLYARGFMARALGVDDMLALLGFALAVAISSLEIAQVQNGSGSMMSTLSPAQLKAFFALLPVAQMLFFLASGLIRLSILAFIPRLGRDRVFIRCVWGIGVVIVSITLAAFIFFLLECKPIGDLFDGMNPDRNCAIKVILVFCVGLAAIVMGILRLGFMITTDFAVDTTYKMARVAAWVTLELHVGLWCGSFPALQPLLRLVSYKVGLRSHLDSTNKPTPRGTETGTRPGASRYIRQLSAVDPDPESDGASARAIVSGGDSTTEFVELGHVDKGGIKTVTDVTVRVEDQACSRDRNEMETTWDAI